MHEQGAHAPVACAQMRPCEQGAPDTTAALTRQHRHAELGMAVAARDMRHTEQVQAVVGNAEHHVPLVIDARDVGAQRVVVERHAETQPPVFSAEREEMRLERGSDQPGQLTNQDVGQIFLKDSRAAASVASISAAPCAADTKPASYADGARYTPRVSIS